MNILTQIANANYLATPETIEKLAATRFDSQALADRAQGTYFRAVLASTQKAIAGKPTLRVRGNGRAALTAPQIANHLETFERVNAELYGAVIRGSVTPEVADSESLKPEVRRERSLARNRRTNYARTAASAIRGFIRGGGDLTRIAVGSATKSELLKRGVNATTGTPESRVERAATRLMSSLEALGKDDEVAARELLQTTLKKSTELLAKLGGKSTTKPDRAMAEHLPLKTSVGTFYPAASIQ
jgi:hypothetical protein